MLYYPINPNEAAGGGGGGFLLGVAYIQRDADFATQSFYFNKYLTNCSYKLTSGEVGSLDSATGRITLPEGCRIFRQSFHEVTQGLSGIRAVAVTKETYTNNGLGNPGQTGINGVHGVSAIDVENDAWVEPVFIQLMTSGYVLEGSGESSKHIGMVEFFK